MSKVTPCLWFAGDAAEAADFYVSVVPNSRVTGVSHYGPNMPMPEGTVLTVEFELDGATYTALNGGPEFHFTEAISLQLAAEDQAEVDHYWSTLSEGGEEGPCGWLKDRYGLSWQIVPTEMQKLMTDPNPARANAATQAMMGMKKLDIAAMKAAADAAA